MSEEQNDDMDVHEKHDYEVKEEDDDDEETAVKESTDEDEVAAAYSQHGGDPRTLDLGRCLLVNNLPNSFLADSFDVFEECMYEMLCQDFNISRETLEKVIRCPKLNPNAESQDSAVRAIVMFKSRVHKHRVFAQKRLIGSDGGIGVSAIDEIPKEMLEVDDIEIADEVGDEDYEGDEAHHHDRVKEEKDGAASSHKKKPVKKQSNSEPVENDEHVKEEPEEAKPSKPAYVNEDLDAPFEINWDGAPEFQWKLVSSSTDGKKLTLENLLWSDLRNPFIYRAIARADSVDVMFPTRYNTEGTKQFYGKLTMIFGYNSAIMQESINHLIYVRTTGRRIKIFLPQTPQAMKQKDELETRLGRLIQPTLRMRQLVVKIVSADKEYTIEDAKAWFPQQATAIENFEVVDDEMGQKCAIVTMNNAGNAVDAHSSHPFVNSGEDVKSGKKLLVLLRGVEAHFGSLLTRMDRKAHREENEKSAVKRPAESSSHPAKKPRGAIVARAVPPRGRGTSRGSFRGGSVRGRGGSSRGRGGFVNPTTSAGSAFRFGSQREMDDHSRMRQRDLDIQERVLRQQQMLDMNMREGDRRHGYGYEGGTLPYNGGYSNFEGRYNDRFGYPDNRRDTYAPGRSSYGSYERR